MAFTHAMCVQAQPPGSYTLRNPDLFRRPVDALHGLTTDILADYVVANYGDGERPSSRCTPRRRPTAGRRRPLQDGAAAPWRPGFRRHGRQPAAVHAAPAVPARGHRGADSGYRLMTRVVPCLDDSVRTLLDGLGDRAKHPRFYLSDNGFLHGEHRRSRSRVV